MGLRIIRTEGAMVTHNQQGNITGKINGKQNKTDTQQL